MKPVSLDITIIHGSGGTPSGNWFPWLATELRKRGHSVIVPEFPRPEQQNLRSWMECFDTHVKSLTETSVLIGHSTGVALSLNILQRQSTPIAAAFLVAGFVGPIGSEIYDPLNASFFEAELQWDRIQRNAGEVFVYAGDDDPYVPLPKSIELATLLDSELVLVPKGGHLNYETGYLKFDRLLRDFDRWVTTAI
jgi:predicted alpha/beta hydrolase family esterase